MRFALACLLVCAGVAHAAPTTDHPLDDQAGVIAAADQPAIEDALRALRPVEMAVIVVQSLGGSSIESYAASAARDWATGRGDAAVLVLAIGDRKSRIEVSDSLRVKFPDRRAQAILDNSRGYLQKADYAGAITAIVGEVRAAAGGEAPDLESPHPQGSGTVAREPVSPPVGHGYAYRPDRTDYTGWIIGGIALAIVLLIGFLWASSTRSSTGTLTAGGFTQRAFALDWGWHALKVIGWIIYIIFVIASSGRSSSRSWSSSSSSRTFSSSSGGGGWSGGGASSSW